MGSQGGNELAEAAFDFRVMISLSIASVTFLIYDHLLSFADEVEYVWKATNTLPKYLFFINRYGVPLLYSLSLQAFSGIGQVTLSDEYCQAWAISTLMLGPLSIANGSFIILLRLWALWDRRMSLVLVTLGCFLACQVATFAIAAHIATEAIDLIYFSRFTMSCYFPTSVNLFSLWLPGVFFELVTAATAWWAAISIPRTEDAKIAKQLYKDGSIITFVFFVLRVLNMLVSVVPPEPLRLLGIYFIWAVTTLAISRMVLNLRKVSAQRVLERQAMLEHELASPSTITHLHSQLCDSERCADCH